MNDEWRLQVDPREEHLIHHLVDEITALELKHDLSEAFHDRVVVDREGDRVFLYAGTREQAEKSAALIHRLASEHGWSLTTELKHWHPTAEEWEDPDVPLPAGDAERKAEHAELIATERSHPEFEVRVECGSRREAHQVAAMLRSVGVETVHRFRYVLVGAADEDSAKKIAMELEQKVPAGSRVKVEGIWSAAVADMPPNPYAMYFGGLGA
jgi:hypothetical protein